MSYTEFLNWLHEEIPLTAAMQVNDLQFDGRVLSLSAPLEPNLNDKGTGFAGATSGLATLTGWCVLTLWLNSRGIDADVMIARSEIEYRAPLTTDLHTRVELPDTDILEAFETRLRARGRARLPLNVALGDVESPVLLLSGEYVARIR